MTAVLNNTDIPDAQTLPESQNRAGVRDTNLPQPSRSTSASCPPAAATNFPDAHSTDDSHPGSGVGDPNLPQPSTCVPAKGVLAAATNFPDAQSFHESQPGFGVGDSNLPQPILRTIARLESAAATNLPDAQRCDDSHARPGVGDLNLPQPTTKTSATEIPAAATNLPDAHKRCDSQTMTGVGDQATETAQLMYDSQRLLGGLGAILADPTLAMCADVVDDLEKVKIANHNRLRTLTMEGDHGQGMTLDHADVKRLADIVAVLDAAEHQAVLNLQRVMRAHPLGAFVKNSKGIGEKQAARLLASIRDPYWNDLHNRPRKLRELYRFCGMDVVGTSAQTRIEGQTANGAGVAPSKRRGERVHWSPDARMRLWLIASKCVMVGHGGPYRAVYDEGRIKYADAVHAQECKRCGPKGKPAEAGSPLSAGHQNARAIRLIAKAILRDLWTESKRIHEASA